MKSFAQRDFVNSSSSQLVAPGNNSLSNQIGKVVMLCLSTIGIVYTFAFMWMAHG